MESHRRRTILTALAATPLLAGCLGDNGDEPEPANGVLSGIGGTIDSVVDNMVLMREDSVAGDGRVVAINVGSGEEIWSFGGTDEYHWYSQFTIADAIYFGLGDDGVGGPGGGYGELYALEYDGTKRWTNTDIGSVYDRPVLDDDTLYVASDDYVVRAIDSNDGDVIWEAHRDDYGGPDEEVGSLQSVEAVDDFVYLEDDELIALDPTDGYVHWRYGGESRLALCFTDDIVYVRDGPTVAAVSKDEGEELWSQTVGDVRTPINSLAVGSEQIFARVEESMDEDPELHALGRTNGERLWDVSLNFRPSAWQNRDDRVYASDNELYAYDATDGTEVWSSSIDDEVRSVEVFEVGSGHELFVETDEDELHRITQDGELVWSELFEPGIRSVIVEEILYVSTQHEVFSFELD